jgi:hypothetical protein
MAMQYAALLILIITVSAATVVRNPGTKETDCSWHAHWNCQEGTCVRAFGPLIGFGEKTADWEESIRICQTYSVNGSLVVVNSPQVQAQLPTMIIGQVAYIGLRQPADAKPDDINSYEWLDGVKWVDRPLVLWKAGEPSNHESEHCVTVDHDGLMNNVKCGKNFNYICRRPDTIDSVKISDDFAIQCTKNTRIKVRNYISNQRSRLTETNSDEWATALSSELKALFNEGVGGKKGTWNVVVLGTPASTKGINLNITTATSGVYSDVCHGVEVRGDTSFFFYATYLPENICDGGNDWPSALSMTLVGPTEAKEGEGYLDIVLKVAKVARFLCEKFAGCRCVQALVKAIVNPTERPLECSN